MRAALALALMLAASGAARADCRDEIRDIMDRTMLAGPYRTEASVSSGGGPSITLVTEVVPPDDVRTVTTARGKTRQMLKIGLRVWVDEGNGFKELPAAAAARIAQLTTDLRSVAPNLINDAQCLGTQTEGGRDFTVYNYKMDAPGDGGSSTNTLFVDPASRLPARVLVEARRRGTTSQSEIRYTFDPTIRLAPPLAEP